MKNILKYKNSNQKITVTKTRMQLDEKTMGMKRKEE